jgi:very-short-patch-repair endonuclease/predicted transcriptional regulator of viral defense system
MTSSEAQRSDASGPGAPGGRPSLPIRHGRADHAILSLASAQHGVVTRAQLLRAGISQQIVKRRLKSNFLRPMHRGVYIVGQRSTPQARALAATYACGDSAAVSHEIAAHVHGLIPAGEEAERVHVSLARGDRRRPGVRTHRVGSLPADEITTVDGIPVTTPARTLLDIASVVSPRRLEKALIEALARGLTSLKEVDSILQRHPRHPGAALLRAALGSGSPARARSVAERRFVALLRKARLPTPEINVTVEGCEVDFLWRSQRLIVEVDGRAYHSTNDRFENDRRRDRILVAAGYRVMRITWRQLVDEPMAVAVQVAQALAVFMP